MSDRKKGFALLIVLWTLGFLSLLGTQIIAAGRTDLQLASNLGQEATLEAAANGATEDVVFRMLASREPGIRADGVAREIQVGPTSVLVQVWNESDRVNLNTASGALLQSLITEVGAAPPLAARLAAAILDWRTASSNPRRGGAKAADYRAAGLPFAPPGTPFLTVQELAEVAGMTPGLFDALAPHLTVLTDNDPDMSTGDPVVARALEIAAVSANDFEDTQQTANQMLRETRTLTASAHAGDDIPISEWRLRIKATAIGNGSARYAAVVVATADFQSISPRVRILLRERHF